VERIRAAKNSGRRPKTAILLSNHRSMREFKTVVREPHYKNMRWALITGTLDLLSEKLHSDGTRESLPLEIFQGRSSGS
jgi:hypothetical protein